MNELNLQNPEFLEYIGRAYLEDDVIIIKLKSRGSLIVSPYLRSPDKLIDSHQRWFFGKEKGPMISFEDLFAEFV
jgi:hypothetical protein